MGLDFSHCDAHWSYSGFHSFRERIGKQIGVDIEEAWAGRCVWPDDPIVGLLDHSDCDGELSPEECAAIAPRLREIVKDWDEGDLGTAYDKEAALELADGMEKAAEFGEALLFQ